MHFQFPTINGDRLLDEIIKPKKRKKKKQNKSIQLFPEGDDLDAWSGIKTSSYLEEKKNCVFSDPNSPNNKFTLLEPRSVLGAKNKPHEVSSQSSFAKSYRSDEFDHTQPRTGRVRSILKSPTMRRKSSKKTKVRYQEVNEAELSDDHLSHGVGGQMSKVISKSPRITQKMKSNDI